MRTGVIRMDQLSAGEVGGIMAGALAALAALGKSLAWLLNWNDTRREDKEARLAAWEKSLVNREQDYRREIETRLDQVQHDLAEAKGIADALAQTVSTLVIVTRDLASELEGHAPNAHSLLRAKAFLATLPLMPTPANLANLARRIDAANAETSAH